MATAEHQRTFDVTSAAEPDTLRRSRLYRWGVAMARHRRAVLAACALVLVVCSAAYPVLQKALGAPNISIYGSDSARVEPLIERLFPLGSENNVAVFHSASRLADDRTYRATIAAVDSALRRQKGVRSVLGPYDPNATGQILPGEHDAFALVTIGGSTNQRFNATHSIQAALTRAAAGSGVDVWLTGSTPILRNLSDLQKANIQQAERIGVPVAFLILLFALGGLVAATLPLLLAFAGLLLAFGVLTVLALLFSFDSFLLAMVTLIGLGIGIDYSLFIVSRFREELARSSSSERVESERIEDAVGVALATSGRTILFSGVIVALSLASLFVVSADIFREIAVGAVVVAACMLAAAMTLLPAMLALLGARIDRGALPRRLQPADARARGSEGQRGAWARWARLVMRRPVLAAAVPATVLLLAAIPILHLHYGFNVGVLQASTAAPVKGEKLLARLFSPGAGGPIQIVLTGRDGGRDIGADVAAAGALTQELESDPRITAVNERRGGAGVLLLVIPSVEIDSAKASALVRHIRNDLVPALEARGPVRALVGGPTAQTVDAINQLDAKTPLILLLILCPSLLFLLAVFRSVVLPFKAVLMNLLVTGATVGLVVWVFQDGHGSNVLNFTSTGFIQVTVPLVMFALLFGLSMDYEVFLIRRVQEEWRRTGDNTLAIATGIEHTGRPIAAAAAIMVAVFGCFMVADLSELKQLGFALAVAIALDATLVRLVLVPATLRLLGERNWWLPAWLERILPNLGVD